MRTPVALVATVVAFAFAACGDAFTAGSAADAGADVATADGATTTDGSAPADASDASHADVAADAPGDHAATGEAGCGDTMNDPENCGRCGHSCLGGGCAAGACLSMTLASALAQPTSVVAYNLVTGTRAVWAQQGVVGTGALSHCHFGSGNPCMPVALASATNPRQLVLNASGLFWFDQAGTGAVQSLPVTCNPCSATTVADTSSPDVGGSLAADATAVFWTTDTLAGELLGAPVGGGGAFKLVSPTSSYPTAVTVDVVAGAIDWVDGLVIKQCPNTLAQPCSPTTVIDVSTTPAANPPAVLVVFKGTLYWTSPSDGVVAKCLPGTCAATLKIVASNLTAPVGLAVDDSGIYWAERSSLSSICKGGVGRVATCPLTGCSPAPLVLAGGEACPVAITTTARAVVWADEGQAGLTTGAVRAIAKP